MSIQASLRANISIRQDKRIGPADNPQSQVAGPANHYLVQLLNTAAPDHVHVARVTINAQATYTLDLDGTLKDLFGDAAAFATIRGILVANISDAPLPLPADGSIPAATDAACEIAGDFILTAYGAAAIGIPLPAGGRFFHGPVALAVTASTGDELTIENLDATDPAYVDIIIIGDIT